MTNLLVYDSTAEVLEKVADLVDERPADIIEVLLPHIIDEYDIDEEVLKNV